MNVKHVVELTEDERDQLLTLTRRGKVGARTLKRAQILLSADRGVTDSDIASVLSVGTSTVYRIKKRFVEGGLSYALPDRSRPGGSRKLSGKQEALLIALACSEPPEGRSRWTLQLLTERLVASTDVDSVSSETIRRRLAENDLKPWQKRMWCIPTVDANYVAHMEDVLDVYAEPEDPDRPVVCFDETFKQLVKETRQPLPAEPGKTRLYDYEYRRNGTANIFVFFDRHRCWREVKPTAHRANADFAECMRELVDVHYPDASCIRVVLDNLSIHRPGALYSAFPAEEARRILRRLEFHYTPRHGSWLNMVEIEIGILSRQCLNRRIGDFETLTREAAVWTRSRNESGATIKWLFDVDRARKAIGNAYPSNLV